MHSLMMKIRHSSRLSLALKPATILHFLSISGCLIVTILVMFMHSHNNAIIVKFRGIMQDSLLPIISIFNIPARAIDGFNEKLKLATGIYEENNILKNENMELLAWQNTAKQLQKENGELRELLGLPKPQDAQYVSARVIGHGTQGGQRTLLLQHAKGDMLKKGYIVVTASGMVGRLIDVSNNSATVLLITDRQSRIPVQHEPTEMRSILTGQDDHILKLKFVKDISVFEQGDRIVSDDTISAMPLSVNVGYVSNIDNNEVSITPFVDSANLKFVSIVIPAYPQLQQPLQEELE